MISKLLYLNQDIKIEAGEVEVVEEETALMREGRLQRVEIRRKEFLLRRMVMGILEEVWVGMTEYRVTEMATEWVKNIMDSALETSILNGMMRPFLPVLV